MHWFAGQCSCQAKPFLLNASINCWEIACCWKSHIWTSPVKVGPYRFLKISYHLAKWKTQKNSLCYYLSVSPSSSFCLCLASKHKSALCSAFSAPYVSSVFWPWVPRAADGRVRPPCSLCAGSSAPRLVRQLPVSLWRKAYVSVWLQTQGAPDTGR